MTDAQPPKRTPPPCGVAGCQFWRNGRCTRSWCSGELDRDLGPAWPKTLAEMGGAL